MMADISLALYQERRHAWGKKQYNEWRTRNERNGRAWMKEGV
jgi:hypothetical protein